MTADMDPRIPPNDRMAEEIVLGSMMASAVACATALGLLVGSDFYVPNHGTIFETIAALHESREPTEIGAVYSRLLGNGTLVKIGAGPFLLKLVQGATTPGQVAFYASSVAEKSQRRALIQAGTRIVQRAFSTDGSTADEMTDWAAGQISAVKTGTGEAVAAQGLGEDELMADAPAHRWVIPKLVERGDRLMLTGAEGLGKSTLTRQIAVCAAAGLNPFTQRLSEPCKVLVVDCENGRALTMRRYRPLLQAAKDAGRPVGPNLRLYLESGGLDLTQRGGSGWLMRRVEKEVPDLIVIGPLYRLHFGDPNDERDARRVAAALDSARNVHGAALIVEAHSPHVASGVKTRTLRPVGSSLWMRWPEFGFGLRRQDDMDRFRVSDFVAWRGPRAEREWPKRLRSGEVSSSWPWILDEDEHRSW